MPRFPKSTKEERESRALENYEKLGKKARANLGGGTKNVIDAAKASRASAKAKAKAKAQDLPEEAAEGMRGFGWDKAHSKGRK